MNTYSATWFELFMQPIPPSQTQAEAAFLTRVLPRPRHRRVLDICCGTGRHADALATMGYEVVGIDRSDIAITRPTSPGGARFVLADAGALGCVAAGSFDATIVMWQSFAYFDAASNLAFLTEVRRLLAPHGRLVLDVYNRRFFEHHLDPRSFQRAGMSITETRTLRDGRLKVRIDYGTGQVDAFDWQVFDSAELSAFARNAGLEAVLACSNFDEACPPSDDVPRMQLVLQATPPA